MTYLTVKSVHIVSVAVTGFLFLLRGWWMWSSPQKLDRHWVRIVPHVVDTILLGSGISLVLVTGMYPTQHTWLAAKLVALLVYILLGMTALRFARGKPGGKVAWVLAVFSFLYMVTLAVTKTSDPSLSTALF